MGRPAWSLQWMPRDAASPRPLPGPEAPSILTVCKVAALLGWLHSSPARRSSSSAASSGLSLPPLAPCATFRSSCSWAPAHASVWSGETSSILPILLLWAGFISSPPPRGVHTPLGFVNLVSLRSSSFESLAHSCRHPSRGSDSQTTSTRHLPVRATREAERDSVVTAEAVGRVV